MGSQKRNKTKYPGVYFRFVRRIGGPGKEKVYYVLYKKDGRTVEEKVGKQYRDNMTPAKAANIRGQLIEGRRKSRREKRVLARQKRWTMNELWKSYEEGKIYGHSLLSDKLRYDKYIRDSIGEKEPSRLNMLDIERIKYSMKKENKAPQTQKHVLALIKRIANHGVNHGFCNNITFKIKMPLVDNKVTEDLSPEELTRLLEAIEADPNRTAATMMKLALFTGMRRGEMFKLQWSDVNFHRRFILIRHPKGGKSQEIPLNKEAEKLLSQWPKTKGSPYVFPGKGGKQRVTIGPAARRIRKRAGLPETFRPLHGLRHVYASMLASSGQVDMYTLQKLLTHKSPVMTQRYAHLRDKTLRQAADLAGDIIGNAAQKPMLKKQNN
ncbi:tyrosine-type recombinase/integrase [Desulfovulcanus sp.]